jgi:hypothetical protein
MFGGQHRSDEAETARASWGGTSETKQPQRRDSRAVGKVCSCTEKIRIKPLETVGVVRDNALTGQVSFCSEPFRGLRQVGEKRDSSCHFDPFDHL